MNTLEEVLEKNQLRQRQKEGCKIKLHLNQKGDFLVNSINENVLELFSNKELVSFHDAHSYIALKKKSIDKSDLKSDIRYLSKLFAKCDLCVNSCMVNRFKESSGICGIGAKGHIYMDQISEGEELIISPTYEIYYSGCNMSCNYCHQQDLYPFNSNGKYVSKRNLTNRIKQNVNKINSISFLGGNPEQSLLDILLFLLKVEQLDINIPYVLNSNFLFNRKVSNLLNRYFDVFLPDFKFGNDHCAMEIAKQKHYVDVVKRNIISVKTKNPLIIRHLPMSSHLYCCTIPIIDWIASLKNKNRYIITIQDSLYEDNSIEKEKCVGYALKKNVQLIY